MTDGLDQAVELVLSVLGGVVLPDGGEGQDQVADVVTVLPVRRRGRKKTDVPSGQGGSVLMQVAVVSLLSCGCTDALVADDGHLVACSVNACRPAWWLRVCGPGGPGGVRSC